ncbi:hypothetical protein [Streptomyces sp. NPDC056194]
MTTDVEWLDHWLRRAPAVSEAIIERIKEHLAEEADGLGLVRSDGS